MHRKAKRPVVTESYTIQRRFRFGKAGGCSSAMADGLAHLLSYGLRSGLAPQAAIKALSGISCYRGPRTCLNEVAVALILVLEHLETGTDLNALIEEKDFADANLVTRPA